MKLALILILLLSFASCTNIVGKAINDINVVTGTPGVYIDGPTNPERIDIVGQNSQLFEIYVFAAEYSSLTGYEYDLTYSGAGLSLSQVEYGGAFGTIADTDYYCLAHTTSPGLIEGLACTGLLGGAKFPNTDNIAYLNNITFSVNQPGTVVFDIASSGTTILADQNGDALTLTTNTGTNLGPGHLELLVCKDFDDDGAFSTGGACGAAVDCEDTNSMRSPGQTEVCDNIDNNCNTLVDDGADCSTVTPNIIGVNSGANNLLTSTPPLSGTLSFTVTVTDTSHVNSTWAGAQNLEHATITIDGNSFDDFSFTGTGPYTYSFTGIDSSGFPEGINTMTVEVFDLQGLSDSVDVQFDLNNQVQCDATSIVWGSGNNPEIINDNGATTITIQGTTECQNLQGASLSYTECDQGVCTDALPAAALAKLPLTFDFDASGRAVLSIPDMIWWDDTDDTDGDNFPEIRATFVGNSATTHSTNLLQINNVAPLLGPISKSGGLGTAQVSVSANEDSRFTLRYGTTNGGPYPTVIQSPTYSSGYTFTITGLPYTDTTYYFTVTARDIGGLETTSPQNMFNTTSVTGDIYSDPNGPYAGEPDTVVDIWDLTYAVTYFRVDDSDTANWPNAQSADLNDDRIINILDLTKIVLQFTVGG